MGYTALVYVHGIGEQQRYLELARLIERLERYAAWYETDSDGHGEITRVTTDSERDRIREGSRRTYLRIHRGKTEVRAYEGYWAPYTAGGRSARKVARWILRQWPAPLRGLKGLLRDGFHLRHRRHIAMLYECVERRRPRHRFPIRVVSRLLQVYHDFIEEKARSELHDSVKSFENYCEEKDRRVARLAQSWRSYVIRRDLVIFLVLTSIVVSGLLLVASLAALVLRTLDLMPEPIRAHIMTLAAVGSGQNASGPSAFEWWQAVQVVLLAFLFAGGGRFLARYLGDVQVWATYQETEQDYRVRAQILKEIHDLLLHILEDEQCERMVIVGHSLGTAIAFEALIALGQHNETFGTPKKIDRIDHFITLGSPIDKIHYFFTYDVNTSPRFERTIERLRGDLANPPFAIPDPAACWCRRSRPHLHWINIYDRADIIAGALHSPSASRCAAHRVDNLALALLRLRAPGRSHLAYFDDWRVLQILYGAIFDGQYAFARAPKRLSHGRNTEAMFLAREGEHCSWLPVLHGFVLTLPWLALLAWVMARVGLAPAITTAAIWLILGIFLIILVIEWLPGRPRHPLQRPAARSRAR
jgi:pimeloyl-ACP methyl ester carboxylesterase